MDVALDANVLINNYWLDGFYFKVLFDYIRKTQSTIFIHQIVKDEARSNFKRVASEARDKLNNASESASNRLHRKNIFPIDTNSFVETVLNEWDTNFQKKIDTSIVKILPLEDSALREAIRRAIDRVPPCHQQGEQMRDAIIWLNLIEYCKKHPSITELAFISENTNDFADKDKTSGSPPLTGEIGGEA